MNNQEHWDIVRNDDKFNGIQNYTKEQKSKTNNGIKVKGGNNIK